MYWALAVGLAIFGFALIYVTNIGRNNGELKKENKDLKALYDAQTQLFKDVEEARDTAQKDLEAFKKIALSTDSDHINELFQDAPKPKNTNPSGV